MAKPPSPPDSSAAPLIFSGEFRHALDSKNRITIPSRWRSGEIEELFVVPDPNENFLVVMPPPEFRRVSEMVALDPAIPPKKKRIFIRHFYSRAQPASTDRQGRLVLPDDYCKQVGLKNEVVLVGSFGRFEVWSPARWKQSVESAKLTYEEVADVVGL
jgi:MraZ protein